MNILIPDSWLREFLQTKATPKQIKEFLSLCGPSVERIHEEGDEFIYDIEITTNRPDAMSVIGVAREAAAILPRFGIAAKLKTDPYAEKVTPFQAKTTKTLTIKTNPVLNPRWTSIVLEYVTVKPSPDWLRRKLEASGMRSLNNIIDVTNYLMRCYGQPAHAFDFDAIADKPNHATMILRASKKGEKITTLDGKRHTLPSDDIVIEDGKGKLVDLCGVMGAQNSAIKKSTKTVILFLQTYDPMHIRRTMMNLAHRTEAGGLFEKGIDPELVYPAFFKGVELVIELSGGRVASKLYDIYPKPYRPYTVSLARTKAHAYIGKHISDKEVMEILNPLGFQTKVTKELIVVTVPSFRRDVTIDVDIIEELARIYGYHNITSTLPDTAPPVNILDTILHWEEEIKIRLRDWGYTETYTYSMISEELMDIFGLDKTKAYKINNPLSEEWVYMRPTLTPSLLLTLKNNSKFREELKIFELSMIYRYRPNTLPEEEPNLVVMWNEDKFLEAKGLAESLFLFFGVPFPTEENHKSPHITWYTKKAMKLGVYGALGVMDPTVLIRLGIKAPVTRLYLNVSNLVRDASPIRQYRPPPKYPPIYEDFTFVVPPYTAIGPLVEAIKSAHGLISDISLLDTYEDTYTLHVTYQSKENNLTDGVIRPIRKKLITIARQKFGAILKKRLI